jgi:hypothetical protein
MGISVIGPRSCTKVIWDVGILHGPREFCRVLNKYWGEVQMLFEWNGSAAKNIRSIMKNITSKNEIKE